MERFRIALLLIGASLCLLTILLLIGALLFPNTFLIIAISNTFMHPFVWGMCLIVLFLLLRKEKKKKGVFEKLFTLFYCFR